jgi:hypothetical protein
MHRLIALSLVVACALCACTDAAPGPEAASAAPQPVVAAPVAANAPAPATAAIGHYTLGEARVALVEALLLPGEPGELTLMLTPTALSPEERAEVLASTTWPGMPLMSKRTAEYPDRYPFVTVKLSHEGAPDPANVRNFYIMAYGIAEPNHTDNINGLLGPDAGKARLERLERQGDRVLLKFSGEEEISGETRSWEFDIPA